MLQTTITIIQSIESLFNDISSFQQLKRIIAYCKRFVFNCKLPNYLSSLRRHGILTATELHVAETICILTAQRTCFKDEILELKRNKFLKGKSVFLSLAPFVDSDGVLRFGGRLQNSSANYNAKHPIILHGSHILSIK